jgi:phosphodiesterase/alkaline phosphatase D-like protein
MALRDLVLTPQEQMAADGVIALIAHLPHEKQVATIRRLQERLDGENAFRQLAARLREAATEVRNDGTPSQVGMSADEHDEWANKIDPK